MNVRFAWVVACSIACSTALAGAMTPLPAFAGESASIRVDIAGVERSPGTRLHVGPSWSLRADAGRVVWVEDDTAVRLRVSPDSLVVRMAGRALANDAERVPIRGHLVVSAPGVDLVARRGSVEFGAAGLAVVVESGGAMSGRGAWAMAVGMGLVVLVLMRRATLVQRRLDRPRASLRARGSRPHPT